MSGRLLVLLGLIPTAALLLGFARATSEALRWHGGSDDAPLVAMSWTGLAAFVSFTYVSPTIGAPKAIYLLPLAVPAALFFVRGLPVRGAPLRVPVLVGSAAAALLSALVFAQGLWFPPIGPEVMNSTKSL